MTTFLATRNRAVKTHSVRFAASVAAASAFAFLTGCGMVGTGANSSTTTGSAASTLAQGHVFGGNQPVTGASIKLYAAGASGYGTGATLLNTSAVTTDSNGSFTLTGNYSCTTGQLVYLVASGGNTGSGTNAQSVMMVALGACPAPGGASAFLSSIPYIWVNEVTTAAAVYALQQFMAPPSAGNVGAPVIGAPSTSYSNNPNSVTGVTTTSYQSGQIGLQNAFTMAKILADISQGTTPNTNYAYATPQSTKLYTIANILASCVNTTGTTSGAGDGTACGTLFADATPSSTVSTNHVNAADTVQAAWYMAQNPANNVSALYNLSTATPPFNGLAATPTDLTIAVNFAPKITSSGNYAVSSPVGIAFDAYGNAWVSNTGGLGSSSAASLSEIGVDGSAVTAPVTSVTASTTGGSYSLFATAPTTNPVTFAAPKAVSIDLNNNAWTNLQSISNGSPQAGITAEAVTASTAAQTGGTGAVTATSTGYYTVYQPWGLAIDGKNNVYVTTSATSSNTPASYMDQRSLAVMTATGGTFTDSLQGTTSGNAAGGTTNTGGVAPGTGGYSLQGGPALLAIDTNTNGPFIWAPNQNGCKTTTGVTTTSTYWGGVNAFYISNIAGTPPADSILASGFTNSGATGASSSNACVSSSSYVGQTSNTTFNSSGTYTTMDPSSSTTAALYSNIAGTANPFGVAVDKNNGVWITDLFTSSAGFDGITYYAAPTATTAAVNTAYTWVDGGAGGTTVAAPNKGTTLNKAGTDAVDGNSNVWAVGQSTNNFVEGMLCNGSTTPACTIPQVYMLTPGNGGTTGVGFTPTNTGNMMATPIGVAIDPSGNVWGVSSSTSATATYTSASGSTVPAGNAVTVLVGAAGPVVTPLSVAIANNRLGQKP